MCGGQQLQNAIPGSEQPSADGSVRIVVYCVNFIAWLRWRQSGYKNSCIEFLFPCGNLTLLTYPSALNLSIPSFSRPFGLLLPLFLERRLVLPRRETGE